MTRTFTIFDERGPRRLSAEAVLALLEEGMITLDVDVMLHGGTSRGPLRRWIRELVFIADEENRAREAGSVHYRSLFETAFDDAPIGMVLSDLSGTILRANAAASSFLGLKSEDLVGRSVGSLSPPADRAEEIRLGNDLIAGRIKSFQVEKQFMHASGTPLDAIVGLSILRSTESRPARVIAHITDIREQKRLEGEAAKVHRMEAVSSFAGGIAHDFNNLLTAIGANVSLAREAEDDLNESLDGIESAIGAAERLVAQLRTLHGATTSEGTILDIVKITRELVPTLEKIIPPACRFEFDCDPDPIWVRLHPSQYEQIILNLVVNAGHASQSTGGTVRLEVLRVDESPMDDPRAIVRVVDEGVGMSERTRTRIFEPFFTTRRGAGGSGLGLSTVQTIVERFNGDLSVASSPGAGSIFAISWPLQPAPDAVQSGGSTGQSSSVSMRAGSLLAGTRVLTIDDQGDILKIVRRMLIKYGCSVVGVGTKTEACHQLMHAPTFDVVLADVVLTDGYGPEVERFARANDLDLPFIFMSGLARAEAMRHFLGQQPAIFLSKPFSPTDLRAAIVEVLSEGPVAEHEVNDDPTI